MEQLKVCEGRNKLSTIQKAHEHARSVTMMKTCGYKVFQKFIYPPIVLGLLLYDYCFFTQIVYSYLAEGKNVNRLPVKFMKDPRKVMEITEMFLNVTLEASVKKTVCASRDKKRSCYDKVAHNQFFREIIMCYFEANHQFPEYAEQACSVGVLLFHNLT